MDTSSSPYEEPSSVKSLSTSLEIVPPLITTRPFSSVIRIPSSSAKIEVTEVVLGDSKFVSDPLLLRLLGDCLGGLMVPNLLDLVFNIMAGVSFLENEGVILSRRDGSNFSSSV